MKNCTIKNMNETIVKFSGRDAEKNRSTNHEFSVSNTANAKREQETSHWWARAWVIISKWCRHKMAKWPGCFFRELIAFNHFNRIGAERLAVTVLVLSCLCWWMSTVQITKNQTQRKKQMKERKERRKRRFLLWSSLLLLLINRTVRGSLTKYH